VARALIVRDACVRRWGQPYLQLPRVRGPAGRRCGSRGGLSRAIGLGCLLRAREPAGCEADRGYHCRACALWSRESTPNLIDAIDRITNRRAM